MVGLKLKSNFTLTWVLVGLLITPQVLAEATLHEYEPNNTHSDFHPISGEIALSGTMMGADQDGFLWTVSDNDSRKRWSFELQGIPGARKDHTRSIRMSFVIDRAVIDILNLISRRMP